MAIILFLIGALLVISGAVSLYKGSRFDDWQSSTGEVITTKIAMDEGNERNGYNRTWQPAITYRFQASNNTIESTNIGGKVIRYRTEKQAKLALKHLLSSEGKVRVFYNPEEPEQCQLTQPSMSSGVMALIFGIVLIGVGFAL